MIIEGLQKLTLLDYPGKVACTIFSHGCNLRCPFCHNAGLVVRPPERVISEKELSDFFEKRQGILDGVALTGGEPLLHSDAVEYIRFLKNSGLSVKLDTNGFYPERLKRIIDEQLVDYIATDIKASPEGYAEATGIADIDLAPLRESIGLIMNSGIPYEFRTTAVKGLHTHEDFTKIGEWIAGAEAYFIQKFTDSGDLIKGGYDSFTDPEMRELLERVKPFVPSAELRGV